LADAASYPAARRTSVPRFGTARVRLERQHCCVQEWFTAAISVAGTLGGAGVGYRGALAINRHDHTAAVRDRARHALAEYLGTLYVSVAELRDLPSNKPPNWLDQKVDALRGEQGAWVARRRTEYKLSGDRYRELAGRLATAAAQLQVLPLPDKVRQAVDAANAYVEQLGEQRTPELKAKWPEIHAGLMAAVKTLED
jgi:hypothetical protein